MERILKTEKFTSGYNRHILNIRDFRQSKNAELISSKSGDALKKDIDAIFEIIEKENKKASSVLTGPNNHPKPSASFASPKPIQRPRDTAHNNAKNAAKTKPAKILGPKSEIRNPKSETSPKFQFSKKINKNAKLLKSQTILLGIIIWRKSYTKITISKENIVQRKIVLKIKFIENSLKIENCQPAAGPP